MRSVTDSTGDAHSGPMEIFAYTDGACSGNPGPGGWGVLLLARKEGKTVKERAFFGGESHTTNNRMELTAAIEALEALERPSSITLRTDSRYLCDGVSGWMRKWKRNNWQTAKKEPVKNVDLWVRLDRLCGRHEIKWQWVKGHANEPLNARADQLARDGMRPWREKQAAG